MIHLLDTGPLVSALARDEPRFGRWAKNLLRHLPRPLYTCEAVLTEAPHFLGDPEPVLAAVTMAFSSAPGICVNTTPVFASSYASTPVNRWIWPTRVWLP